MPMYEFICPKCEKTRECFFEMSQEKEREDGVPCLTCGLLCERQWSFPALAFVKHTYVGDVWEKNNIEPVKSGTDSAKRNRERVKKMREENVNKRKD